jgi:uncharacterized protein YggE
MDTRGNAALKNETGRQRRVAAMLVGVAMLPVVGFAVSQAFGSSREGDGYPSAMAQAVPPEVAATTVATVEESDEDFVDDQENASPGGSAGSPTREDARGSQDPGSAERIEALRRIAALAAQPSKPGRITMSGEGVFRARPDAAVLRFGVRSHSESAGTAMDVNAKASRKLHEALAAVGVKPEEISTDQISVEPEPDAATATQLPRGIEAVAKRGYVARNSVAVDVRNLPARPASFLGDLVMAARGAGANEVSGPDFKLIDDARPLASARKDAVDDATVKAATFAHALGVKIGRIVEIREGNTRPEPVVAMAMRAAASPPIATGVRDVVASVVVVWEVDQP